MQDNDRSPVPEELRWQNWAVDPESSLTGEKRLIFVELTGTAHWQPFQKQQDSVYSIAFMPSHT